MRIPQLNPASNVASDDILLLEQKTTATSGTLVVGTWYLISTLESGDNFTNVGYISAGVWFKATATTPTTWTNSTAVVSYTSKSLKYGVKTIEIGDWNMDADAGKVVPHGLSATEWKTIRKIDVTIRNDADLLYAPLDTIDQPTNGLISGGVYYWDDTNIELTRTTGSGYDDPSCSATSYNRGWITFTYTPD